MSNAKAFGFGQFIPGFDFLQQLSQAGQSSNLPPFSSWIAPTVSVEEIDKRIEELKAVQFWLEQNSRALTATVQALQVQKMTLSTLKGMNVNLADFAQAFGSASAPSMAGAAAASAAAHDPNVSNWPMGADSGSVRAAAPQPAQAAPDAPQASAAQDTSARADASASAADADQASAQASNANAAAAMQWWNALTQQFQTIASQALQDPAQLPAMAQAASMASDFTKAAVKTASDLMQQAVQQASAPVRAAQAAAAAAPKAAKPTKAASKPSAAAKKSADSTAPSAAAKKTSTSNPAAKTPATKTARKTSASAASKKPAARQPKQP